jgi:hypothetical protein
MTTAVLSWSRLSFRIQRWEVLAAVAGVGLLVAALLGIAWRLRSLAAMVPGCDFFTMGAGCDLISGEYLELVRLANRALMGTALAPVGLGLLLGVPIVAREVEQGTASLTWALFRSRSGWSTRRSAIAAAVLVGLLAPVAVATELLAAAALPAGDLSADFSWHGQRGAILVVRGLAALGIGLFLGAVIGRLLPGLLVAGFAALLTFGALGAAMDRWLESEAIGVRFDYNSPSHRLVGYRSFGHGILIPSGQMLTYSDIAARGIPHTFVNEAGEHFASEADMRAGRVFGWEAQLIVPGERYGEVVLREAVMLGGLALALGGGALAAVRRRRPY